LLILDSLRLQFHHGFNTQVLESGLHLVLVERSCVCLFVCLSSLRVCVGRLHEVACVCRIDYSQPFLSHPPWKRHAFTAKARLRVESCAGGRAAGTHWIYLVVSISGASLVSIFIIIAPSSSDSEPARRQGISSVTRSAIKKTGIGVVASLDLDSLFAPLRACHLQPGHVSVSDSEQRSFRLVKVVVY
jgi:hypothetical protein